MTPAVDAVDLGAAVCGGRTISTRSMWGEGSKFIVRQRGRRGRSGNTGGETHASGLSTPAFKKKLTIPSRSLFISAIPTIPPRRTDSMSILGQPSRLCEWGEEGRLTFPIPRDGTSSELFDQNPGRLGPEDTSLSTMPLGRDQRRSTRSCVKEAVEKRTNPSRLTNS